MRSSLPQRLVLVHGLAIAAALAAASPIGGDDFEAADRPRELVFPGDHGDHPEFKTEWWYLTGSVTTPDGELLGFQATWFRSALVAAAPARRSNLATRDLFFFHGALTDVARKSFHFGQVGSRGAPDWASAERGSLDVAVLGRRLTSDADGSWRATFDVDGRAVELRLTPTRTPLLHGEVPGLSRKGPRPGQASYYYSHTRLRAEGTVQRSPDSEPVAVEGTVWFDHEFGSNQLAEDQVGWDWFSVALDDGSDLMLYLLRREDGTFETESSGTLRRPDGTREHLRLADFRVEVLETWRSPRSDATYPARWRLRVPDHGVDLEVRPVIADQELDTRDSTGVTYWEGLCEFTGRVGERGVGGRGYVELVGYASRFRARI